ncbi:energy-coupling factor transport system ATP-binding protein [Agreia bicolorata]|uniref:Energy-coupling factor transport system ATP-binding protein n=1 Tax=Agreia bicolorata TaxID=110935 RepID=A0A1T4XJS0_9MICO|nr:ABC transporter ATP-binding protein [Agreia bicolorata]SKA89812.1 energy-coupling factor transport system ATP-binding protein [Agreia bicolorata]
MTDDRVVDPGSVTENAPAPIVRVQSVSIRHDDRAASTPSDVTFDVAPGEVVLILGPSGCGKSTLALALNGLVPHAVPAELTGTVTVGGMRTADETVARLSERVAMVFQDPDSQMVTGTLLDEVAFGPENLLVDRAEVLARAEESLRQVGLWERRGDNPDLLSGGGRQRLAIACALAMKTPILVLDEPTANLDPAGIEEVYEVLRRLVDTGDHAIVLVEHNLDAAIDLVDRVIVLDAQGRLAMEGPTRQILINRVDELLRLGVWLPVALLAALRLRDAGITLDPLPLTPRELTTSLDAQDALPTLASSAPDSGVSPAHPADTTGDPNLAVRVTALDLDRGRTRILNGIDLAIERGSFVAIVGTNGAGKTTLLQAIAGVIRAPAGRIQVLGVDPAKANARTLARTIGFVFQNPEHQFIKATVAEELAHGPQLQQIPVDAIETRVSSMLDRFGLQELRDEHPFLLSGGQKRRLSVGTALIDGAPLLALDEPTFGQDRARASELLSLLDELNAEGTTVLVVTHDLQLVAEHCSHILVLDSGRVAAFGPTAPVLASDALESAGLRTPPLARAFREVVRHPAWRAVTRLSDLPAGATS